MKQVNLNPFLNLTQRKLLSWAKVHVRVKGLQHRTPARKQTVGDGVRILEHVYTRIEKELPVESYEAASLRRTSMFGSVRRTTPEKSSWLRATRVFDYIDSGVQEDPFFVHTRIPTDRHIAATFNIMSNELLEFIAMLSSRRTQ